MLLQNLAILAIVEKYEDSQALTALKCSKAAAWKTAIQKSIVFFYASSKPLKKYIILFLKDSIDKAIKCISYLGIN